MAAKKAAKSAAKKAKKVAKKVSAPKAKPVKETGAAPFVEATPDFDVGGTVGQDDPR